jgi:hypothetical protein
MDAQKQRIEWEAACAAVAGGSGAEADVTIGRLFTLEDAILGSAPTSASHVGLELDVILRLARVEANTEHLDGAWEHIERLCCRLALPTSSFELTGAA